MSIPLTKKRKILKVSSDEYELLMYKRARKIPLKDLRPGGITFNYNTENQIRSHVISFSPQPNQIILVRNVSGPKPLAKE